MNDTPDVIAMRIEEGLSVLQERGYRCVIEETLPPQRIANDRAGGMMEKRIVRQKQLSPKKVVLMVVYVPVDYK